MMRDFSKQVAKAIDVVKSRHNPLTTFTFQQSPHIVLIVLSNNL